MSLQTAKWVASRGSAAYWLLRDDRINVHGIKTPGLSRREHQSARMEINFRNVDAARKLLSGRQFNCSLYELTDELRAQGGTYFSPGEVALACIALGLAVDESYQYRAPNANVTGQAAINLSYRGQQSELHDDATAAA